MKGNHCFCIDLLKWKHILLQLDLLDILYHEQEFGAFWHEACEAQSGCEGWKCADCEVRSPTVIQEVINSYRDCRDGDDNPSQT